MRLFLLESADIFFFIFHSLLILFNLFGWIPARTRRLNLVSLLLTGLSWSVLGIWQGFGYCPLTEWHYRVRWQLGKHLQPDSYIDFLMQEFFSLHLPADLIDAFTLALFLLALCASLLSNLKKRNPG